MRLPSLESTHLNECHNDDVYKTITITVIIQPILRLTAIALTPQAEQYPTHSVRAILNELRRPWTPVTEAQTLKVLATEGDT